MDTTLTVPWTLLPKMRAVIITSRDVEGRPPEECGAALWAVAEVAGDDNAEEGDDGITTFTPGPRYDVGICTDRFGTFVVVPLTGLRTTDPEAHRVAEEAAQVLGAERVARAQAS